MTWQDNTYQGYGEWKKENSEFPSSLPKFSSCSCWEKLCLCGSAYLGLTQTIRLFPPSETCGYTNICVGACSLATALNRATWGWRGEHTHTFKGRGCNSQTPLVKTGKWKRTKTHRYTLSASHTNAGWVPRGDEGRRWGSTTPGPHIAAFSVCSTDTNFYIWCVCIYI